MSREGLTYLAALMEVLDSMYVRLMVYIVQNYFKMLQEKQCIHWGKYQKTEY